MAKKERVLAREGKGQEKEEGKRGTYEIADRGQRSEISSTFPIQPPLLFRPERHINRFRFTIDPTLLISFVFCGIHSALLIVPSEGNGGRSICSFFFVKNNVFTFGWLLFGGFLVLESKGFVGIDFLRYASEKGNDAFNTSLEQSFVLTINRMSEGYVKWNGEDWQS